MSITIRRMREEDILQAVEIEKIAFSRPWSKSIFKATLLLPYAAYYVAVDDGDDGKALLSCRTQEEGVCPQSSCDDGKMPLSSGTQEGDAPSQSSFDDGETSLTERVVGLCGVKKVFEEGDISNVAVHPDYRRRGIARKMLELLMQEARQDGVLEFTLEVRAGNTAAVTMYESFGFRTEGVRPGFYDHPVEDGLIMWLRQEQNDAQGSQWNNS